MSDDRPLLDAIPDAIFIHDADGDILDVNQEALGILGYERDELLGMTVWDLADEPDRESVSERWSSMDAGEIAAFDGEHRRPDGSTFPVRVHVGRIYTDDEPRYLATVRDVSERVERQRELERKNERLEQFTSVVSHDLRNPLNVVKGRLELAQETGDIDHLEPASRGLDRMEALITDLLTLAREGEAATEPETVELASLVDQCWKTVETSGAALYNETERVIRADRGRLRQLLENLVRNAVEHGDGDVTIRVGDLESGFYVADDGPGIPAGDREQVLEAGYTTAADGTGFGLAIVSEVADAHGWDIRVVESESGGARFEFTGVEEPARQATERP